MEGSTSGLMLVLASTVLVMLIGFGIAFYFQRRTKTAGDWAMGGRSLPSYVIVFTQFATLVGGGVLVGHVARLAVLSWPSSQLGFVRMSLPLFPTFLRKFMAKTASLC